MHADHRQYTQRSVLTATPGQLVVMLYDGMIRFLSQGRVALEKGDIAEAANRLGRAQAIVTELRCTLDLSRGPIAHNLASIYDWAADEITAARLGREPERLTRLAGQMSELRASWAQIAATEKPRVEGGRPVVGVNLAG